MPPQLHAGIGFYFDIKPHPLLPTVIKTTSTALRLKLFPVVGHIITSYKNIFKYANYKHKVKTGGYQL
jgi:hypothetical protein